VVIGRGKLIADDSIDKIISGAGSAVFVRVSNLAALQKVLDKAKFSYKPSGKGLLVESAKSDEIGKLAHAAKLTVLELAPQTASLEEAFLELTEGAEEFAASAPEAKNAK